MHAFVIRLRRKCPSVLTKRHCRCQSWIYIAQNHEASLVRRVCLMTRKYNRFYGVFFSKLPELRTDHDQAKSYELTNCGPSPRRRNRATDEIPAPSRHGASNADVWGGEHRWRLSS